MTTTTDRDQLREALRNYPDWLSTLNNIVRALEDEGDRVFLGSTNDADDLRQVVKMLDGLSHAPALATPTALDPATIEHCAKIVETAMNERFDCGDEEGAGVFEDCLTAIRASVETRTRPDAWAEHAAPTPTPTDFQSPAEREYPEHD